MMFILLHFKFCTKNGIFYRNRLKKWILKELNG